MSRFLVVVRSCTRNERRAHHRFRAFRRERAVEGGIASLDVSRWGWGLAEECNRRLQVVNGSVGQALDELDASALLVVVKHSQWNSSGFNV